MNVKSLAAGLVVLLAGLFHAAAEDASVIPLWANGAPGFESRKNEQEIVSKGAVRNINNPTITVFLPPKEKANGSAILICPGGGFRTVVYKSEGLEPARYFTNLGMAAFVLKYRLPRETNSPYSLDIHPRQDGQRAMRVIRSRASEWGVDPARLGMIGFSAGGEVVSVVAFGDNQGDANSVDPIERLDASPAFAMWIYPGPLGIPEKAPQHFPPGFILIANDDTGHMGAVLALEHRYHEAGMPMEVHIYEHGGHGFNMGYRSKLASIKDWPDRMTDWFNDNKFFAAGSK